MWIVLFVIMLVVGGFLLRKEILKNSEPGPISIILLATGFIGLTMIAQLVTFDWDYTVVPKSQVYILKTDTSLILEYKGIQTTFKDIKNFSKIDKSDFIYLVQDYNAYGGKQGNHLSLEKD